MTKRKCVKCAACCCFVFSNQHAVSLRRTANDFWHSNWLHVISVRSDENVLKRVR